MSLWIVDTSPLIFLAKLDRLDLLKKGADQVIAPPAVLREIGEYPDAASRKIEEARGAWLGIRAVEDRRLVDVLMADLDAGESEVIALAIEAAAERVVGNLAKIERELFLTVLLVAIAIGVALKLRARAVRNRP